MSLRKKAVALLKEPNFVLIDLVLSGVMVVGAVIVWLVFGR
mgnify:CR=1 FL=1|jgi:hypothetical protein